MLLQVLFPATAAKAAECTMGTSLRFTQQELESKNVLHITTAHSVQSFDDCMHCVALLKQAKYSRHSRLLLQFSQPLAELITCKDHWQRYTLVPVPLHWTRRLYRTFNQSQVLAKSIAAITGQPVKNVLCRVRATGSQARRNRAERLQALCGAFRAKNPVPDYVCLVDDVWTTGATIQECARTLRSAGAKEVIVLTVFHATFT